MCYLTVGIYFYEDTLYDKKIFTFGLLLFSSTAFSQNNSILTDEFDDPSLSNWSSSSSTFIAQDGKLSTSSWGSSLIIDPNTFKVSDNYEVSMIWEPDQITYRSMPLVFGYKDHNNPFYTMNFKLGTWGAIYLSEYINGYSSPVEIFSIRNIPIDNKVPHEIKIIMNNDVVTLFMDGLIIHTQEVTPHHDSNQVGIKPTNPNENIRIDSFTVKNTDTKTSESTDASTVFYPRLSLSRSEDEPEKHCYPGNSLFDLAPKKFRSYIAKLPDGTDEQLIIINEKDDVVEFSCPNAIIEGFADIYQIDNETYSFSQPISIKKGDFPSIVNLSYSGNTLYVEQTPTSTEYQIIVDGSIFEVDSSKAASSSFELSIGWLSDVINSATVMNNNGSETVTINHIQQVTLTTSLPLDESSVFTVNGEVFFQNMPILLMPGETVVLLKDGSPWHESTYSTGSNLSFSVSNTANSLCRNCQTGSERYGALNELLSIDGMGNGDVRADIYQITLSYLIQPLDSQTLPKEITSTNVTAQNSLAVEENSLLPTHALITNGQKQGNIEFYYNKKTKSVEVINHSLSPISVATLENQSNHCGDYISPHSFSSIVGGATGMVDYIYNQWVKKPNSKTLMLNNPDKNIIQVVTPGKGVAYYPMTTASSICASLKTTAEILDTKHQLSNNPSLKFLNIILSNVSKALSDLRKINNEKQGAFGNWSEIVSNAVILTANDIHKAPHIAEMWTDGEHLKAADSVIALLKGNIHKQINYRFLGDDDSASQAASKAAIDAILGNMSFSIVSDVSAPKMIFDFTIGIISTSKIYSVGSSVIDLYWAERGFHNTLLSQMDSVVHKVAPVDLPKITDIRPDSLNYDQINTIEAKGENLDQVQAFAYYHWNGERISATIGGSDKGMFLLGKIPREHNPESITFEFFNRFTNRIFKKNIFGYRISNEAFSVTEHATIKDGHFVFRKIRATDGYYDLRVLKGNAVVLEKSNTYLKSGFINTVSLSRVSLEPGVYNFKYRPNGSDNWLPLRSRVRLKGGAANLSVCLDERNKDGAYVDVAFRPSAYGTGKSSYKVAERFSYNDKMLFLSPGECASYNETTNVGVQLGVTFHFSKTFNHTDRPIPEDIMTGTVIFNKIERNLRNFKYSNSLDVFNNFYLVDE
jgi:hypothetical protein